MDRLGPLSAAPAPAWPHGQARWIAFAAALNDRMQRLQLHVEPDWRYALCTVCGWDLELFGSAPGTFRYDVASHVCPAPVASTPLVPAPVEEVLF